MNLDAMVSKAYSTNWTKINNYTIQIHDNKINAGLFSKLGDEMLNLALKSVTLPPLNQQGYEVFVGGSWHYANGRPDLARVELTFRDYDYFKLYKAFVSVFESAVGAYPGDCFLKVQIDLDKPDGTTEKFAILKNCLIENVSQLQFSTDTENQIAEFSVTLRGERQMIKDTERFNKPLNKKEAFAL